MSEARGSSQIVIICANTDSMMGPITEFSGQGIMRASAVKRLFQAHLGRDDPAFRKAALQIAADESRSGHTKVAAELRSLIADLDRDRRDVSPGLILDIAQPRGPLAELLTGEHRRERFRDIVLTSETHATLTRIILENRSRDLLSGWDVEPRRKILFHGPPGCGKTLAAAVIAGEMGLPLMTVRFDALFSRFLGATANHLRLIFDEMPNRPAVYLFDEFDAVAARRGNQQDIGEMRRIVTSFLQLIDTDQSAGLLIAATNHSDLLDHAVFRRFDASIHFDMPDEDGLVALLHLRLRSYDIDDDSLVAYGREFLRMSFADAGNAVDDALRTAALTGLKGPTVDGLIDSFRRVSANRVRKDA